jgi:hypothetical protein
MSFCSAIYFTIPSSRHYVHINSNFANTTTQGGRICRRTVDSIYSQHSLFIFYQAQNDATVAATTVCNPQYYTLAICLPARDKAENICRRQRQPRIPLTKNFRCNGGNFNGQSVLLIRLISKARSNAPSCWDKNADEMRQADGEGRIWVTACYSFSYSYYLVWHTEYDDITSRLQRTKRQIFTTRSKYVGFHNWTN